MSSGKPASYLNISVERRSRDGSETEEQSESKQTAKSGSFGRGKTECSDKYEYDKSDNLGGRGKTKARLACDVISVFLAMISFDRAPKSTPT